MDMVLANQLQAVDSGLRPSPVNQSARQDFENAYAWTKTQETGPWRDGLLARLAYIACANRSPHGHPADLSAGSARDEAIISVLHQWALRDPEAAKVWADSFPDDKLKTRALAEIQGLQTGGLSGLRR